MGVGTRNTGTGLHDASTRLANISDHPTMRAQADEFNLAFALFALRARAV